LYEYGGNYRQVYTDGRTLPADYSLPSYLGYSVGRSERDTFVVETAGFNDQTVLDAMGHRHSDQLRVVERFRRRDFGHLDVELTFDDPKLYTRPFTIRIPQSDAGRRHLRDVSAEREGLRSNCQEVGF